MIVAETPSAYRFVTQPAHARLAGQFAATWGAGRFDRPAPFEAVRTAARRHDDGWEPYDRRPRLGDDGTPVTFTALPPATWIELYDRGIAAVAAADPYAGLLVSMHGTGLRRRRYGLSPSWPDTPAAFEAFVARQEARQRELAASMRSADDRVTAADEALLAALHETGAPPDGTTSRLWANYALLQAWDTLSLALCTTVSPPGRDAISDVPTGPGDGTVTLEMAGIDRRTVAIEPYPFRRDPLSATVAARTVERSAFDSESTLVGAYRDTPDATLEFTLRSPG